MWVTTGDAKVRFPSAEVAWAVYTQQRKPSRGNNSGLGDIKDITCKRASILIPNGVSKADAENVSLNKDYLACSDYRGIDNLQLQALTI